MDEVAYLIVNADDFGLSPAVNRGILELHQAGFVTSATLMVNMPGAEDAVRIAKESPALGVGMHFNLTYGSPVAPPAQVPSLVDEQGRFSQKFSKWKERDVVVELLAQYDRFLESGLRPTHLDSHQHVHKYRFVYRPMVYLAHCYKIPMRRVGWEHTIGIGLPHPPSADRFILDTYFKPGGTQKMVRHLRKLKPGVTELMCHPGYVDEPLREHCEWTDVRVAELRSLQAPEVIAAIRQPGIVLIHYGDLGRGST